MRRLAFLVSAVLLIGGAAAVPAAASDDPSFLVPLRQFRDIAVDEEHGWVFLTGGGSQGVVVRTLDGGAVATLFDHPGASGMALSPDNDTLYVALEHGDAIATIDTATLLPTGRIPTGVETCPQRLAMAGTSVWFGYGCGTWDGDIGVVDVSGTLPVVTLARLATGFSHLRVNAPPLVVDAAGTRLVAGVVGSSSAQLHSFSVSGTTLTHLAEREVGGNLQDFALTPDGTRVLSASGSPYFHPRYVVDDLSSDGVYGSHHPYPNAVAQVGSWVAAGVNAAYDPDVRMYRSDGMAMRTYELGQSSGATLLKGGLAFTPSGDRLFAVTGTSPYDGDVRLHVLRGAAGPPTTITASPPASPRVGTAYTMNGTVSPARGGLTVHVTRRGPSGESVLPDTTTAADGTFAVTDTASRRGTHTYRLVFDGDDTSSYAAEALTFGVLGKVPDLRIATDRGWYAYGATAKVTAHLAASYSNRTVRITATPVGDTTKELANGPVDAMGDLRASQDVTVTTTFAAHFAGDEVYEPRTVSLRRQVAARVTSALYGHYARSGAYHLYRRTANPVLRSTIAPVHSYQCTTFEAQRYVNGGWRTFHKNTCVESDHMGRMTSVLGGSHPVNVPHRVRAAFNGDQSNMASSGPWLYLRFT